MYRQFSVIINAQRGTFFSLALRLSVSFLRLRWDRWALADPRDLRDPLVPLDSSGLVVTPEIPDRSASADPLEPLDPPDLPERR